MSSKTTSRFGIRLITLHWLMLVLIVAVYLRMTVIAGC